MTATTKSCLKGNQNGSSSFSDRSVHFDQVHVIELPIILGDNPSPSEGVPITVGWKAQRKETLDVQHYEMDRHNRRRRSKKGLKIPSHRRTELALLGGCSCEELSKTCWQVADIQLNRAHSSKQTTMEALKNRFKGIKLGGSSFTKMVPNNDRLATTTRARRSSWANAAA